MRHTPLTRRRFPRRLLLGAGLLFVAACKSGTEPTPLSVARSAGDQQAGSINAVLTTPLTVRVTDGTQPVSGVTVTWTVTAGGGSVSPASSVTDASGNASTTWTLGPTPGDQRVTATVDGGTSVEFRATATAVLPCEATITLGVGAVCLASPTRAAQMQVAAGANLGEFVAIPFYDGNLVRSPIAVNATAQSAVAVTGPPTPDLGSSSGSGFGGSGALIKDIAFERRLRRLERESLRQLVGAGRGAMLNVTPGGTAGSAIEPAAPRFAIGDQVTFNTNPFSSCSSPVNKSGTVRQESANAIIVEDNQNPAGGFTAADYTDILNNFETIIRPSNVDNFGGHTDIDNNNRIIIFYTIEVNRLTDPGSTSIVGGYFFSRDLFRKEAFTTPTGKQLQACAGSNQAEMFYMLAPDPQGCFNSGGSCDNRNIRTTASVKQSTSGTIAHEYEHLINASRRLYITPNAQSSEAVWLDEGLAHIAEELAYYRATGLSPRQNLTIDDVRQTQGMLDLLNTYQVANLSRYNSYVKRTNSQSPYGETPSSGGSPPADWDDLETRGAIWSFLRWAADHRGNSDGDTWQRLVRDATATGTDNLSAVFGANIGSRFREWAAATYMDDAPGLPQLDVTFRQPSWNFRSVISAFQSNNNQFPLQVFSIANTTSSFNLVDGGAAYLRFGVPANGTATVAITQSGGGQLPAGASVWVVRTK